MIREKKSTGLWRGLTAVMASLLAIIIGATAIVKANATFINGQLGITNYKIVDKADGEKVVLACAVNGMFGGMTDQYFCVQFTSAFLANRLKKDDFRKVLEAYLERLSGSPLRLTVEVEELSEAPKKTKEATPTREKSAKEAVEALPPEARAAVEPLVEIFGDDMKIMPAEEMEDGIHRQESPPADM